MKTTKSGLFLIVLGNFLYITEHILTSSTTAVGDFVSGLLLGLSIGTNLIGIILVAKNISETK